MWQPEFLWFFTIFHHEFRKNNPIAFEVLMVLAIAHGRTFQCGEGWHSNENAVRFWTPSPRVPKEADTRCYACTTAYATMIQLCNACWAQSKTPTPSLH